MIPLSQPDITATEIRRLTSVLGKHPPGGDAVIIEFERRLAAAAGAKYAITVNSATAARYLILTALGVGPGDAVITTAYGFSAASNCILQIGATPVFCDIGADDCHLDPNQLAERLTPRTKAILIPHVCGLAADMEQIMPIADRYRLPVIEDIGAAIGAKIKEKTVGSWGVAGISILKGGAIITNDKAFAQKIRNLVVQGGREPGQWPEAAESGGNYRLDELSAALGSAQLGRLNEIMGLRARIAAWYREELASEPLLVLPQRYQAPDTEASWSVYVIRFTSATLRQIVADHLLAKGIQTHPYLCAIHLQPFYRQHFGYAEGAYPQAEKAAATALALPCFAYLSHGQVVEVSAAIRGILDLYRY
jgi:perosamine synthetase